MNVKYGIAKTVSISFMLGAAAGSFHGEVALSQSLGLTWEAYTVPFLIDGMAVLGLLGRGREFAASTQRAGLVIAIAMGTLSLACNILAGHNLGQRLYGALIVGVFLASEWYATKLDRAPVTPAPAGNNSTKTLVTETERVARKRAGYDSKSPQERAAWTKQYRARRKSTAPVSPGMVPVLAPSLAEVAAAVR